MKLGAKHGSLSSAVFFLLPPCTLGIGKSLANFRSGYLVDMTFHPRGVQVVHCPDVGIARMGASELASGWLLVVKVRNDIAVAAGDVNHGAIEPEVRGAVFPSEK